MEITSKTGSIQWPPKDFRIPVLALRIASSIILGTAMKDVFDQEKLTLVFFYHNGVSVTNKMTKVPSNVSHKSSTALLGVV